MGPADGPLREAARAVVAVATSKSVGITEASSRPCSGLHLASLENVHVAEHVRRTGGRAGERERCCGRVALARHAPAQAGIATHRGGGGLVRALLMARFDFWSLPVELLPGRESLPR